MQRRQLPIGIQHFRTLREDGCYYVDKTPLIHRLVSRGRHYFLSRPRRFGKSLLHGGQVFVMEFKMAEENEETEAALDRAISQIRDRGYADRYRDRGEPIHLLAAVFGREERNLLAVRAEPA